MSEKQQLKKENLDALCCGALSFFFPDRCPGCDEILKPGQSICLRCDSAVRRIRGPVCVSCGKPLMEESGEYCTDCRKKKHYFTQGKVIFCYEGRLKKSLYRFKYGNRREYAVFYAKEAAKLYAGWIKKKKIEVIVPIPMFFAKKRQRGYNQAEVFAKTLGKVFHLPVDTGMLCRVRNTTPQKELNQSERKYNLKNAFQLRADIVKYSIILLADDIYTTGSTIDEASRTLLAAGVKKIYFICIGIGTGYR